MHQPLVLSRALNTHNYRKDVTEVGGSRDRNPSTILGKAQESLFSSKTGLRRLFGGAKDDVVGPVPDDQTETVEIRELSRNTAAPPPVAVGGFEDAAATVGKLRRSSMTTYTINLGATSGSVQREVRRLAGLVPNAFGRPNPSEPQPMHATSFDAVEEMNAGTISPSPGAVAGYGASGGAAAAGTEDDKDGDDDAQYAFQGPTGGGRPSAASSGASGIGGPSPAVRTAFSNLSAASPFDGPSYLARASISDDAVGTFTRPTGTGSGAPGEHGSGLERAGPGGRGSLELVDLSGSSSQLQLPTGALETAPSRGIPMGPPSRVGPRGSVMKAPSGGLSVSAGGALGGGSFHHHQQQGQGLALGQGLGLGVMKDRKGDGYSSSPGPVSPVTPGAGGPGGMGGGGSTGTSPNGVLRLPTLPQPAAPSRGGSNAQIGRAPSFGSATESRPGSSRALLRGAADRRGSLEPEGSLGGPNSGGNMRVSSPGPGPLPGSAPGSHATAFVAFAHAGPGAGAGAGAGAGGGAGGNSGGGGGRWFQPDTEDLEYMLAGNDEMLQRMMAAGGSSGGGGGGGGGHRPSGEGEYGGGILTLPRLSTAENHMDRATAHLMELRRVQAAVDDQLARERQAIAAGRVRRASVLEDVAGQQQPRWQISYNPDAPVTHAKLGTVDASRRSELEKAHLAKLVKEQKSPGAAAAAVSPVVARARRLSTMVA